MAPFSHAVLFIAVEGLHSCVTFILWLLRIGTVLTSNTSTVVGPTCPSTVLFTCTGQDIPTLIWFINDNRVAHYFHRPGDEDRVPFNVNYDDDLGPIQIISVQANLDSDVSNITSTFITNTSILEQFTDIQCGPVTAMRRSELMMINVSLLGKSPHDELEWVSCMYCIINMVLGSEVEQPTGP
jgi:hypothetical protein